MIKESPVQTITKVEWQIATLADEDILLQLMEEFNQFFKSDFNAGRTRKNLRLFFGDNPPGRLWCINEGDACIGYVVVSFGFSFEYGGKDGIIDEFYLRKEFRNQGIGPSTLEFILSEAKNMHINALHLEIEKFNGSSRGLYFKKGFTDSNRIFLTRRLD